MTKPPKTDIDFAALVEQTHLLWCERIEYHPPPPLPDSWGVAEVAPVLQDLVAHPHAAVAPNGKLRNPWESILLDVFGPVIEQDADAVLVWCALVSLEG